MSSDFLSLLLFAVCVLPASVPYGRRDGMPYSARTCGGGGPGGGPGGFFPGGNRGTPGTVAGTGPVDDERGPLLRDAGEELPQWPS